MAKIIGRLIAQLLFSAVLGVTFIAFARHPLEVAIAIAAVIVVERFARRRMVS